MYIISDLDGTILQFSNIVISETELQNTIERFETQLKKNVIGTSAIDLCLKASNLEYSKAIIINNTIVDIVEYIPEIFQQPTIEERLTIAEDALNFLLGL